MDNFLSIDLWFGVKCNR